MYIVGPESQIDMMPSSKWLAEHTSRWAGFKTHLLINIKRDEALDIISAEGMLLVLCSMVDNMPYVVAEAAVSHHVPSQQSAAPCWRDISHFKFQPKACC